MYQKQSVCHIIDMIINGNLWRVENSESCCKPACLTFLADVLSVSVVVQPYPLKTGLYPFVLRIWKSSLKLLFCCCCNLVRSLYMSDLMPAARKSLENLRKTCFSSSVENVMRTGLGLLWCGTSLLNLSNFKLEIKLEIKLVPLISFHQSSESSPSWFKHITVTPSFSGTLYDSIEHGQAHGVTVVNNQYVWTSRLQHHSRSLHQSCM